jgi:hypothetical protein
MEGQIIQVENGPVPEELARVSEPYDGPVVGSVKRMDASAFVAARSRAAAPPSPPERLQQAGVLNRYGWRTSHELQLAGAFDFPKPIVGMGLRGVRTFSWMTDDLERWEQRLASLGFVHQGSR